jgi:hypothetical protein
MTNDYSESRCGTRHGWWGLRRHAAAAAQWRAAGEAGVLAPRGLAREPTDFMHRSSRERRTDP